MGSLLLTVIISGLTLHYSLAIEKQFNDFTLVRNVDTTKKHFLINRNILFYIVFYQKITMNNWYIFSNIYRINDPVINTKFVNMSI